MESKTVFLWLNCSIFCFNMFQRKTFCFNRVHVGGSVILNRFFAQTFHAMKNLHIHLHSALPSFVGIKCINHKQIDHTSSIIVQSSTPPLACKNKIFRPQPPAAPVPRATRNGLKINVFDPSLGSGRPESLEWPMALEKWSMWSLVGGWINPSEKY